MTPAVSIYLNLLRVFAALFVFLPHLASGSHTGLRFPELPYLGLDAVMVFFVLSGYVVAYVSEEKERSLLAYGISRSARILSITLPALGLTLLLHAWGSHVNPGAYEATGYQFAKLWVYLPLWLGFGAEFWFLNESMLENAPFWSLCFEVWFYIAFAVWNHATGARRVVLLLVLAGLAGPKFWLLGPCWGLGALLWQQRDRLALQPASARLLFAGCVAGYLLMKATSFDDGLSEAVNGILGGWPRQHLQQAWLFPGDYLRCALLAGTILGMRHAGWDRALTPFGSPAAFLASFSFSLYMVHTPIVAFMDAWPGSGRAVDGVWWISATVAAVFVVTVAFGLLLERRAGQWRLAIARLANAMFGMRVRLQELVRIPAPRRTGHR